MVFLLHWFYSFTQFCWSSNSSRRFSSLEPYRLFFFFLCWKDSTDLPQFCWSSIRTQEKHEGCFHSSSSLKWFYQFIPILLNSSSSEPYKNVIFSPHWFTLIFPTLQSTRLSSSESYKNKSDFSNFTHLPQFCWCSNSSELSSPSEPYKNMKFFSFKAVTLLIYLHATLQSWHTIL